MLKLELSYLPPLDWRGLLDFLGKRAVAEVESVEDETYRRVARFGEHVGSIEVRPLEGREALELRVSPELGPHVGECRRRAMALFDLETDPEPIAARLGDQPLLTDSVESHPGLRVPGAWDPFELTVRAILGQQVTVKGAVTLCSRLVSLYGQPVETSAADGFVRVFPSAEALRASDFSGVGLTSSRAATLRTLVGAVAAGEIPFGTDTSHDDFVDALTALPGIGDWTAQYVAMRVRHDGDAFPASDLVLRKAAAGDGEPMTAAALQSLAESWRPWRAYAAMHLWRTQSRRASR